MKRVLLCAALLFFARLLPGQSIAPSVVNTGGGTAVANTITIEWSIGESYVQTLQNTAILTLGILQPYGSAYMGPLPVTGLEFNAKRTGTDIVKLQWKSLQEINNLGFYIERKKENETAYSTVGFVRSLAADGNSSYPLNYVAQDTNNYSGITYYRLKQQDIDGHFNYSIIRMVNGETQKQIVLKAWPVPAQGDITVILQGAKKDILQVIDLSGKLILQVPLSENVQQNIKRLAAGTYILRLSGQISISQKIIFQ